ncbi:MAG: hypothetical protein NT178_08420 [Proteobacteria bacterium]|nr:hypothetical protein [Pseudomonadota bacterium]
MALERLSKVLLGFTITVGWLELAHVFSRKESLDNLIRQRENGKKKGWT